jgi:hypothetical protein
MEHEGHIERIDTVFRILYSVVFAVIIQLLESVLGLIVVFELAYSLITMSPPSKRVREFANRIIAYNYHLQRYLTHNEAELPFPFSDLPEPLEPTRWPYAPGDGPDLDSEPDPYGDEDDAGNFR